MWNKIDDINNSFEYIKEEIKNEYKLALISFDDAYNYYYKYCNSNSLKFVVSKRYFEKYLYYKLSDHVVYEKFIETEWLN
jgi:phage/plasmid-associated DNA primase